MSSLTQVALEPWDPALPLIALYRLANNIPSVITFGFLSNRVQVSFSFANGEQSTVKERLVIHFRNDRAQTGWITTCVDILDKGKVPILFSVEQMRNLRMNIEHTPVGEFMTCPLFWNAAHRISGQYIQTIQSLTLWLLLPPVGNRCTAFSPKTSHAQHAMVNIDHTPTKKVARDSRDQSLSQQRCRNRPSLILRRLSRR